MGYLSGRGWFSKRSGLPQKATRKRPRRSHSRRLRAEPLEDRRLLSNGAEYAAEQVFPNVSHSLDQTSVEAAALAPDLDLVNIGLCDANADPAGPPVYGEAVLIRSDWLATDLTSADQYVLRYAVDGIALDSDVVTGIAGTNVPHCWYGGGWYATPGRHTVTVTLDPANAVAEVDESNNFLSFTFDTVPPTDLPSRFLLPLAGIPDRDWTVVNYCDVDPRTNSGVDYRGGPWHYDEHEGLDITLPNFAHMDAGVPVYAAAAGTVVSVQEGNFDRRTGDEYPANHVAVDHGNGWKTEYVHFATNTITVSVGDTVTAGQLLGLAGSSGPSSGPHLHFCVRHHSLPVETFYVPDTYWLNPLPYQDDTAPSVLDWGVTNDEPWDDYQERPVEVDCFPSTDYQEIWFWHSVSHLDVNDRVQIDWYRPDGSLDGSYESTVTEIERFSRCGWYRSRPWSQFPGTWQVAVSVNGIELARSNFTIAEGDAPAAIRLTQDGTYILDGRTTPIDFGTVELGGVAQQRQFTLQNVGYSELMLTDWELPSGFCVVGSIPTSIAAGGSASFVVQLDSTIPGAKFATLAVRTNVPSQPVFDFTMKGTVEGVSPAGVPQIGVQPQATAYSFGASPQAIDDGISLSDSDTANYAGGWLAVEFAAGTAGEDRLGIAQSGPIGLTGSAVTFGGTAIGTFSGGAGGSPLIVHFNQYATLDAVQTLMRAVTFSNSQVTPESLRRSVRWTLHDELDRQSNQPIKTIVTVAAAVRQGDCPGLYAPGNSAFYLRNQPSSGTADRVFAFGVAGAGWIELVGDWNGDGVDTPGMYDPGASTFYLTDRFEGGAADHTLAFGIGSQGWKPLVGDWDGDGRDGIGVYEPATSLFFFKNTLAAGEADEAVQFGVGSLGWYPIIGDWDGLPGDGFGFYEPATSLFFLKNAHTGGDAEEYFQFGMGSLGWVPLAGNWDGTPGDGVGFYVPETGQWFLKNGHAPGPAEVSFTYGIGGAGWRPLVGCWESLPAASRTPNFLLPTPSSSPAAVDRLDLAALAADQLQPFVGYDAVGLWFPGRVKGRWQSGNRR